jgi:hypothetical protein
MAQRYELYADPIESDEGDYINIEHIKDDDGDWCKADDVAELVTEGDRLEKENERLRAALAEITKLTDLLDDIDTLLVRCHSIEVNSPIHREIKKALESD